LNSVDLIELKTKIGNIAKVAKERGNPEYLVQYRQTHEDEYAKLVAEYSGGESVVFISSTS
jgi:hypothetical protein